MAAEKDRQVARLQNTLVKFDGDIKSLKMACSELALEAKASQARESRERVEARPADRSQSRNKFGMVRGEPLRPERFVQSTIRDTADEQCEARGRQLLGKYTEEEEPVQVMEVALDDPKSHEDDPEMPEVEVMEDSILHQICDVDEPELQGHPSLHKLDSGALESLENDPDRAELKASVARAQSGDINSRGRRESREQVPPILGNNQIYGVFFEGFQQKKMEETQKQKARESAGLYGVFFDGLRGKGSGGEELGTTASMKGKVSGLSGHDIAAKLDPRVGRVASPQMGANMPVRLDSRSGDPRNTANRSQMAIDNGLPSALQAYGLPQTIARPNPASHSGYIPEPMPRSDGSQRSISHNPYLNNSQYSQDERKPSAPTPAFGPSEQHLILEQPQNLLSLKASSLFSSSLLFENDLLSVYSKSFRPPSSSPHTVSLTLTFSPKYLGLTLTTHLNDDDLHFSLQPPAVVSRAFTQDISQTITFKSDNLDRAPEFPVLVVSLKKIDFCQEFELAVPLSVNKFAQTYPIKIEDCLEYLECVS